MFELKIKDAGKYIVPGKTYKFKPFPNHTNGIIKGTLLATRNSAKGSEFHKLPVMFSSILEFQEVKDPEVKAIVDEWKGYLTEWTSHINNKKAMPVDSDAIIYISKEDVCY